jgi:hypothetical protein
MVKHTNEKIPLILSFLACLLFAASIIIAGYIHGNMHLLTVLKNASGN